MTQSLNVQQKVASSADSPQHAGSILSVFDRTVVIVLIALVLLIALVVLMGDRVGVQLTRVAPLETAHSTDRISLQFTEDMNRDTVTERLRFEPEIDGEITWSGRTIFFRPDRALEPGSDYTVILEPGAQSENGREVLSEYRYSFTVLTPRVAYLAPADGVPQNIWLADPLDPDSTEQVTFSQSGIYDFGVSPDGTHIAFAERNTSTGTSDIKLINLETGALQQLTNCVDADCTSPVWRPDGTQIAYQRVELNSDLGAVGASPTRVWLIDLTSNPATTRPLFSDLQILGYNPQWSADGGRIAIFNRDQGILVFDFLDNSLAVVPNRTGSLGTLSPDGTRLVFPDLVITQGEPVRSYLQMADIDGQEIIPLGDPSAPLQDERVQWHPDGDQLAIARRYHDDRYTRGYQVYLLNVDDLSAEPLTQDERYANGFFFFDPTGDQLVIQRFPELNADGQPNTEGRPEIWTYSLTADELTQVAVNAFHPRWVP